MLSKPVAGVTSLVATSEATTLQEIQADNIYLQQTMQVRKRNDAGRQSMSPGSCVPPNELSRTALVMIEAASAVLGWVMVKG